MNTPCGWRGLSNVQCDEVMAHRVVWWGWVGAVPVCPPASPHKGASIVHSPCTMCVFLVWKRRYTDVRAGTQAPPLRFRLGDCAQTVGFVWADYAWPVDFFGADCAWVVDVVWVDYVWMVDAVLGITRGWLVAFGWIAHGRLASFLRYSARMPLRILFLCFLFL